MAKTAAERMAAMRARRAAGLAEAPGLRDAGDLLAPAVEASIGALELGGRDAAAAQLARRYAQVIDQAESPAVALRALGPLLLRVLVALRAAPAARPPGGAPGRPGPNRVRELAKAHQMAQRRRRG